MAKRKSPLGPRRPIPAEAAFPLALDWSSLDLPSPSRPVGHLSGGARSVPEALHPRRSGLVPVARAVVIRAEMQERDGRRDAQTGVRSPAVSRHRVDPEMIRHDRDQERARPLWCAHRFLLLQAGGGRRAAHHTAPAWRTASLSLQSWSGSYPRSPRPRGCHFQPWLGTPLRRTATSTAASSGTVRSASRPDRRTLSRSGRGMASERRPNRRRHPPVDQMRSPPGTPHSPAASRTGSRTPFSTLLVRIERRGRQGRTA